MDVSCPRSIQNIRGCSAVGGHKVLKTRRVVSNRHFRKAVYALNIHPQLSHQQSGRVSCESNRTFSGITSSSRNVRTHQPRATAEQQPIDVEQLDDSKALPRTWYPITVHSALGLKPKAVRVLGEDLVVWRDLEGKVVVQEDKCPHRLVPLSEGHVDPQSGCLECPLHGWQFNQQGDITRIPSLGKDPPPPTDNKRKSGVRSLPVLETGDIVWAWMGDPTDPAVADPDLQPENLLPFDFEKFKPTKTYMRQLPIDQTVVVENFMDPAHIPFAHHGHQGTRDDALAPLTITTDFPRDDPNHLQIGFSDTTRGTERSGVLNFKPPVAYWFTSVTKSSKKKGGITILSTPVQPGITNVFLPYPLTPKMANRIPAWLLHSKTNEFLDSDTFLLYGQTSALEKAHLMDGDTDSMNPVRYYASGSIADKATSVFHTWFRKFYNSSAPYSPAVKLLPKPTALTREEVLDRNAQHVEHCMHCTKAKSVAEQAPKYIVAIALCAAAFLMKRPIFLGAIACLTAILLFAVNSFRKQFGFVDYVHAFVKGKGK